MIKKTNTNTSPHIPPTSSINLEDYAMDNFFHPDHSNHLEKTFPEFINSFKAMLLPPNEDKNKEEDQEDEAEEEEEEEGPQYHLNIIWDEAKVYNEDDYLMEEACIGNDYNLQSKGAPKSSKSTCTLKTPAIAASATKVTFTRKSYEKNKVNEYHPTASKPIINLDLTHNILGALKLDYDVVEDLKMMKENITILELCKITQLREQLHESLQHIQGPQDVVIVNSKVTLKGNNVKATKSAKTSSVANTSSVENKENTTMDKKQHDPKEDGALIRRKSRSHTAHFILTFDIFNQNVHNCLVDIGVSSNVIPCSVCKKLNVEPKMCKTKIIQLDRSHGQVLGELKNVLIHLASNSKFHQMIDIIVVDIPEAYGVIMSIDWSTKLNGYFATD